MKLNIWTSLLALAAAPWAASGQTTVFNDTFANGSSLNPSAAHPVVPTASATGYGIASAKNATATTISGGLLTLQTASTSSGFTEAQAQFTATPITLTAPGQYVEVYFTFKDTANIFNGTAVNNASLDVGLFNSGGSAPTNGTVLWNGGIGTATTADTGGTKNWLGYSAYFGYGAAGAITTRPAQTGANNNNQDVLYPSAYSGGVNVTSVASAGNLQPALTVGNYYTLALTLTYQSATALGVAATLYNGADLSGTVVTTGSYTATMSGSATGTNVLTTTFDALAVGYRATSSAVTTIPISNLTVLDYIPALPAITGLTNATVVAGTSPTLNPVVTGVPAPALQWQANGVNIPGANSATLALNNVQYAQNGTVYSLIASNLVGVVTNSMTLGVIVPPAITGLGNQAGTVGSTLTISPTVTGVPAPVCQWQFNGVNLTDGLDANGATISGRATSTLTIANAQAADSGTYALIASNSAGTVTNSLVLTVSAGNLLPTITGPANQTVVQGNNATFSALVSGLPLPAVQWLDQTGTPIPDATNAVLTLPNVQYAQNGYVYSVVASNSEGRVTNSATLTVWVAPTINLQPPSVVVTNTQPASLAVAATGVPALTYQWYKNGNPIPSASNPTATNATFTIASAGITDTASYNVVVANSAGSVTSAAVTVTVNSAMKVAAAWPVNGATGICYDTPLYLTFSQAPTLATNGTIKIYNATNPATPVDTINLGLNVTMNAVAHNVQPRLIGGDSFTNYPVIITGNQAAIYPHLDVLTSNQTYYVTVDNGAILDGAGANFAGIASNTWVFTTKTGGPANPTNLVVSADGTGDFLTVQGAVDAVPANNTTPTLINIRNGTYLEIVNIHAKHNLLLRGQSRAGTQFGYANNANLQGSTHYRMAFKVNANDIALDNLTVTNLTPVGGSQAEALMLESNVKRFICNNCNVGSYQDTILANGSTGAQGYFANTLITGQFDYIWGGGDLFFTNCEMRTLLGNGGAVSGGNLTASRTDNSASGVWPAYNGLLANNGFSFVGCQFTRSTNTIINTTVADANGSTNGNVAWINCRFDSNYITPSANVLNSQLLWEYGNSNLTATAPVTFGLAVGDSAPALTGTDPRYLAAANATTWLNGWVPQLAPNILSQPASQSVAGGSSATFTVVATGLSAPTYQWLFNGSPLAGQTGATLTIPAASANNAGTYAVVVANSAGTVTSSNATLTVGNTAPTLAPAISPTVNVGVNVSVVNVATDPDFPAQSLTFSLLTGPLGSLVDTNGTFTWRPTSFSADTATPVQVVVIDNGTPALSATNSFTVTVNPLTAPVANAPAYAGGVFSVTVDGQTGPDYALVATTNLATGIWVPVAWTNSPVPPFSLADTNAGSLPAQFYRVVTGWPLLIPTRSPGNDGGGFAP